ncbi:uncharacterized protein LOC116350651 isoform X2 [Contarinia nasturtii]|nr:uncharacterized protein LOC116350651 isoform X2 [Contarinia nasturtii]XP_031638368.1 uncharacterized protein LOC116350651 isoform X2 [Contarinia nasturtii]XP_031638369.1 uncharacterized protein LOC116350651 isoform X2 [Contarinia nasturtii]
MAEKNGIVVDPISSDGSEESWILLDEMDEAMKEEYNSNSANEYQSDSVDSTETLSQSNAVEVGNEAVPTISVTDDTVDGTSNTEEVCPSNEEDDENDDDTEKVFRIPKNGKTFVYDESCDGFTTDGSISILGDHEINQERFGADDLSNHTPSPQPMQMWMRCTPIDMAISVKRPRNQALDEYKSSSSQNVSFDFQNFVDFIHREMFLIVITASLLGIISVMYAQMQKVEYKLKEVELELYNIKIEKYQIELNLAQCYNLYDNKTNNSVEFIPEQNNGDKQMPAVHDESANEDGSFIIQPTKLSDMGIPKKEPLVDPNQIIWTDAEEYDDDYTSEVFRHSECNMKLSEFARKNREYCRKLKNMGREKPKVETPEKIYSTHYSYKAIDDKECNPNKIDFNLGIEHARKVLRDSNCDDEGTMKYLQKAYDNFMKKTKVDHLHGHKEHRKTDKTNGKWDKSEKFEHSVIKAEYDDNSSEEYFDRNDKKDRRDKKQHKDSDKEKNRKNDRKDSKKYHQDKDQGKWNKNERKRDSVKVHD